MNIKDEQEAMCRSVTKDLLLDTIASAQTELHTAIINHDWEQFNRLYLVIMRIGFIIEYEGDQEKFLGREL